MKIGVIGAGIVGSAVAYELLAANANVVCFESDEVMGARSAGDTRIFRTIHHRPDLVSAAFAASEDWKRWSSHAARQLVIRNGVLFSGASAEPFVSHGRPARREWTLLDDAATLVVALPAAPIGPCVLDTVGGVIDMVSVRAFLADRLTRCVQGRVETIEPTSTRRFRVWLDDGQAYEVDRLVIAAGEGSAALASSVASPFHEETVRHSRFTFGMHRDPRNTPAWIGTDDTWEGGFSFYSHRVGPGLWAMGAHMKDGDVAYELGETEVCRRSAEYVRRYVRARMPALQEDPVDVISCTHPILPGGDGVRAVWSGDCCVIWGHNLAKFAPYIGSRVATAAIGGSPRADLLLGEV